MARTVNSPISRRLTLMNILVSGAALVLACVSFVIYDQVSFRDNLVRNLTAQAQIIGSNSISAITFNDPQAAKNTLDALNSSPDILSAGILTPDGKLFAGYSRDPNQYVVDVPVLRPGQQEFHRYHNGVLLLVHSIVFQDKVIGSVYIRSDLRVLDSRLKRYVFIAFIVLLFSLIAALLVSSVFRKSLAEPIISLAETARVVSEQKNYSIRAPAAHAYSELAILIDAFNEMLSQIQARDQALQKARSELEDRVHDRTRQLLAANKELEAFSYSVSHDLRGPLEVINGFSHILLTEYRDRLDANGKDYLERISVATRRMAELIEDLLNLARVTSGALHHEAVDLSAVTSSVASELRRREPQRDVDFVIAPDVTVEGDARLLQLVLENLLRNSWKYTSAHRKARIEFGVQHRGNRIVYFVRDDGAGFDPRYSDRLFRPFQRLHSTSDFPGTGIGLATVQRIIHRHGGEVWAEGAVEKGAVFYFTLNERPALAVGQSA